MCSDRKHALCCCFFQLEEILQWGKLNPSLKVWMLCIHHFYPLLWYKIINKDRRWCGNTTNSCPHHFPNHWTHIQFPDRWTFCTQLINILLLTEDISEWFLTDPLVMSQVSSTWSVSCYWYSTHRALLSIPQVFTQRTSDVCFII